MGLLDTRNAKTQKTPEGYLHAIQYLAPAHEAGPQYRTVCPLSTPECRDGCLYKSGFGMFDNVQAARVARTRLFWDERDTYLRMLCRELSAHQSKAKRLGFQAVVRLNGTSDIQWHRIKVPWRRQSVVKLFPNILFVEYTKLHTQYYSWRMKRLPENLHLTYSYNGRNARYCDKVIADGGTVAIPFLGEWIPDTHRGKPVVNGDLNDLRQLDKPGQWIGLTAKGPAKDAGVAFAVKPELAGLEAPLIRAIYFDKKMSQSKERRARAMLASVYGLEPDALQIGVARGPINPATLIPRRIQCQD